MTHRHCGWFGSPTPPTSTVSSAGRRSCLTIASRSSTARTHRERPATRGSSSRSPGAQRRPRSSLTSSPALLALRRPRSTTRRVLRAVPSVARRNSPVPSLGRVCVFDVPAAPLHVDDDLQYLYTPSDIALFEYVHGALSKVRELLNAERERRVPKGNQFPQPVPARDAAVFPRRVPPGIDRYRRGLAPGRVV